MRRRKLYAKEDTRGCRAAKITHPGGVARERNGSEVTDSQKEERRFSKCELLLGLAVQAVDD